MESRWAKWRKEKRDIYSHRKERTAVKVHKKYTKLCQECGKARNNWYEIKININLKNLIRCLDIQSSPKAHRNIIRCDHGDVLWDEFNLYLKDTQSAIGQRIIHELVLRQYREVLNSINTKLCDWLSLKSLIRQWDLRNLYQTSYP
jgi:hypothetical protein